MSTSGMLNRLRTGKSSPCTAGVCPMGMSALSTALLQGGVRSKFEVLCPLRAGSEEKLPAQKK